MHKLFKLNLMMNTFDSVRSFRNLKIHKAMKGKVEGSSGVQSRNSERRSFSIGKEQTKSKYIKADTSTTQRVCRGDYETENGADQWWQTGIPAAKMRWVFMCVSQPITGQNMAESQKASEMPHPGGSQNLGSVVFVVKHWEGKFCNPPL